MRWRGRRASAHVEDRRGRGFARGGMRLPVGRAGRAGAGGLGLLVAVVLLSVVFGVDPRLLLDGGGGGAPPAAPRLETQGPPANDAAAQFVSVVLADTEDTWNAIFEAQGSDYPEPTLVLFSGAVGSACGTADSAIGPFYCGGDRRLYIDLAFFDELRQRHGAPGDFAQAYVIAHEVGHHVQNVIGVLGRYGEARRTLSPEAANRLSVRVELQADCFAGIWAHDTSRKGLLDPGDLEEALNAASQVGDDAIQRRTRGYIVPDTFNHGTSEQRAEWFRRGYQTGDVEACDTFEPGDLG